MVTVAWRAHRAATALLLQSGRALTLDHLDESAVASTLREAFVQYARAYLAQRTLFGGESVDADATIAQWFELVPRRLASKGTTLLRKLNFLAHASPYRPLGQADEEWTGELVRDELATVADELHALLATETRDRPLPTFRGEDEVCLEPGMVVRYALYDWGEWSESECVVIASQPPRLLLRFQDRHYEEVDATIALLERVPGAVVDLDDAFEARRTSYELVLYGDDVGLYDDAHFPPTLGMGRGVVTCACCGYPTRRLRYPAFLRLSPERLPVERCLLCGWADDAGGEPSPPLALRRARAFVQTFGVAFAPDDGSAEAVAYRDPGRQALRSRACTLFDGAVAADTPRSRAEIWRAAHQTLGLLAPEGSPGRTGAPPSAPSPRVVIALERAFAFM